MREAPGTSSEPPQGLPCRGVAYERASQAFRRPPPRDCVRHRLGANPAVGSRARSGTAFYFDYVGEDEKSADHFRA